MSLNFIDNPNILFIKIIAIAFVTIIYSLGGLLIVICADKYLLNSFYDKTKKDLEKKSTSQHIGELTIILAIYGILAYFGRNILQLIPFPLENVDGFKYMNVKEVTSGSLILWILINYSQILTNKITIIRSRISLLIN